MKKTIRDAIIRGDLESMIHYLYMPFNERDAIGNTPIVLAAIHGKMQLVEWLLNQQGTSIDTHDAYILMITAIRSKNLQIIHKLLSVLDSETINGMKNENNFTILMETIILKDKQFARTLVNILLKYLTPDNILSVNDNREDAFDIAKRQCKLIARDIARHLRNLYQDTRMPASSLSR